MLITFIVRYNNNYELTMSLFIFLEGIPELSVPPQDPMVIRELDIYRRENNTNKFVIHDLSIYGIKNLRLHDKYFINNLLFKISLYYKIVFQDL